MFGRKKRDEEEVQVALNGFDFWYDRDFRQLWRCPRPKREVRYGARSGRAPFLEEWDPVNRLWKRSGLTKAVMQRSGEEGYNVIDVPIERVRQAGIDPNAMGERYVAFGAD